MSTDESINIVKSNDPSPNANFFLTFPPFPEAPSGVKIIPYKEFKEKGIQIFSGEAGNELDGLGIPTVELRIQHETDACKSDAYRKRQMKEKKTKMLRMLAGNTKQEWWERWEDSESLRLEGYDPNQTRLDNLQQAAFDFKNGRSWPAPSTHVGYLWDQFRLYSGLLSITPIWNRTDQEEPENAEKVRDPSSDNESDSDEILQDVVLDNQLADDQKPKRRQKPRPPYAAYGEDPIPVDSDERVQELLEEEAAKKELRLMSFLNNPEHSIKVFLSSYMREQGLNWTERYLDTMPRVLLFFVNYLLRNRVLPEASYERSLRRSVDVINLALKELPLTSKISKTYPDKFSLACMECWGSKSDSYKRVFFASDNKTGFSDQDNEDNKHTAEIPMSSDSISDKSGNEVFSPEEKEHVFDPTSVKIIEDIPDDLPAPSWDFGSPNNLISLLGPSAIPLTHTTGVVELSVRRIQSLIPPPSNTPVPPFAGSDTPFEPDPDGVELELERRFAKVVLSPWLGWNQDEMLDLSQPKILPESRGLVVQADDLKEETPPAGGTGVPSNAASTASQNQGHNPIMDDITLLVDPSKLEILSVGMGLAGTWVQLARKQDIEPDSPDKDGEQGGQIKKKKKKSKGKSEKPSFWYLDDLVSAIPSYWAVQKDDET